MKVFEWLQIKRKLRQHALEKMKSQEYRIIHSKQKEFIGIMNSYHQISSDINPFMYVSSDNEVKYIEDINIFYQDFFDEEKTVLYIIRNPYIKRKQRKQFVDEIIKKWEYDFYKDIDHQLKRILDQASFNPVKKVRKIKNSRINLHMVIALIFMILLRQYSILQTIPFFGPLFTKINALLINQKYYNFATAIVYLSIIIAMYLIIVKVYFDKVLKFGLTAKGFLIKERDRMLRKYKKNIKKLKKHLNVLTKKMKLDEKYPIDFTQNSRSVIKRIQKYGQNVIYRVGIFTTYYDKILLVGKLLQLVNLALIIYLIVQLFFLNEIHIWRV